ncbi:hypothetical protein TDB9533_00210 [Thalassocella blandensis]|nr:hypothetical protein TDB9533_00210 [Thalassocella blandensis]
MTTIEKSLQKSQYRIFINASCEKAWHCTFDLPSYEKWTSAFAEGSTVETDWQEGSEAVFKGNEGHGMVGRIAKSQPHSFLSIEHLGQLKDGEKIFSGDDIESWSGAKENYTFTEKDGGTELLIEMDVAEKYKDMFDEMWPRALEKLKALAEA